MGQYIFEAVKPGNYFVNATFVGFATKNVKVGEISEGKDLVAPDLILSKSSGNLKEVVVVSKKPIIEVKADKTVLNVE